MRKGNPWKELMLLGAPIDGIGSDREAAWDRVDMLREIERLRRPRWWRR